MLNIPLTVENKTEYAPLRPPGCNIFPGISTSIAPNGFATVIMGTVLKPAFGSIYYASGANGNFDFA
jgi:hypothetical protein